MEIILKILEYVIYGLLAVIAIMIPILFYCKYIEAKFARQWAEDLENQLTDAQYLLFKAGEALGKITKDRDDWKLKAIAPMMPDANPPIIMHKSGLQKVVIRTELDGFPIMREKVIREGVDKLVDYIAPLVYSEITEDEYGRKVLFQEIWVGLSEKFKS